jgi:hypothetical protein
MKKTELRFCAAMLALLILMSGCGGPKTLTQTSVGKIPEWYTDIKSDDTILRSPNTQASQDMQLAVDKAKNGCRDDLASQLETRVQNLQKRFSEEVGVGAESQLLQQFTAASKQVISTVLNGARTEKQEIVQDGKTFRAYVLMTLPIGEANTRILQQIKTRNEMYTRFRSTEAFKELEADAQKYEDWKKAQGN